MQDTVNACFPSDRGPPRRALAARASAARARRVPRGAGAVRPGGAGAIDRVPARAADPGRIPGLLPDRARGQAAAAARARWRWRASSSRCADAGPPRRASACWRPVLAIVVYLAMVIPSRTNIGVRHVLPVFPLIAMLAGAGRGDAVARGAMAYRRARRDRRGGDLGARHPVRRRARLLPWFNALAGGQPERVLIDSDLDWGQDLLRLERELAHRRVDRVFDRLLRRVRRSAGITLPHLTWLRPREPAHGWIAISQTFRHGIDGSLLPRRQSLRSLADGRHVPARHHAVRLAGRPPAGGAHRRARSCSTTSRN